jgi:hypothetical protein
MKKWIAFIAILVVLMLYLKIDIVTAFLLIIALILAILALKWFLSKKGIEPTPLEEYFDVFGESGGY